MNTKNLSFSGGVTIVGGGPCTEKLLGIARSFAPDIVCADGGANHLKRFGMIPSAVIGDMDSVDDQATWRRALGDRFVRIDEQDSTDFEKCLRSVEAAFFIAVGFLGARHDHSLAAMHALLATDQPVALLSEDDVVFAAPRIVALRTPVGGRVSIFPLRPVSGVESEGLKWSVQDLALQAGESIGTSNIASSPSQRFGFDRSGALIFLDPDRLEDALFAVGALSRQ